MSRTPPSLRRLHALAAAPARTLDALGRVDGALARLAREVDDLDLVSDRTLAPLLAGVPASARLAVAAHREAAASASARLAVAAHREAAREVVASAPPRPPSPARAAARRIDHVAFPRDRVAPLLAVHPPAPGGPETDRPSRPFHREAPTEAHADPIQPGMAMPTGRRPDASRWFRRKAARAGLATGWDVPVAARADETSDPGLLGAEAMPTRGQPGAIPATPGRSIDDRITAALQRIVRPGRLGDAPNLPDRPPRPLPGALPGSPRSATMGQAPASNGNPAEVSAGGFPPTGGPTRPIGGLRGLAARAATAPAGALTFGSLPWPEPTFEPIPMSGPHGPETLARRVREAELAGQLDELLRREARRHGIDVEDLSP